MVVTFADLNEPQLFIEVAELKIRKLIGESRKVRPLLGVSLLLLLMFSQTGCRFTSVWNNADNFKQDDRAFGKIDGRLPYSTGQDAALAEAERAYLQARAADYHGKACCVDHYFEAVVWSWPFAISDCSDGSQLHHLACQQFLSCAREHGRLQLPHGVQVCIDGYERLIPISMNGFLWEPEDLNDLVVVGNYKADEVLNVYASCGLGVPLIGRRIRCRDTAGYGEDRAYPVTAVIRSTTPTQWTSDDFCIELYDARRVESVETWAGTQRLKRDLSAPFEYQAQSLGSQSWQGFLQPGTTTNDGGLLKLEPYQPGKIPLVFVHGLLSAPQTWVAMANEIMARPELRDRYQLWAFEYPTGQPFVTSAADFREQLQAALMELDPAGQDPALRNMVLAGHSMGGLISKLQITSSGTQLWDSVANVPFDQIVAEGESQFRLARSFFFEPQPYVTRVIYVGTPHRGSALASQSLGRIGSLLVNEPEELEEQHRQLVANNPGVFSYEMRRRVPTSVDLLRPQSELLQAIDRLPRNPVAKTHTIMGTGWPMLLHGFSDGVVPVSSAKQEGVESELAEFAYHTELHRTQEAVDEVICILHQHLQSADGQLVNTSEMIVPEISENSEREKLAPLRQARELNWRATTRRGPSSDTYYAVALETDPQLEAVPKGITDSNGY